MRSKIAERILSETPDDIRIYVRTYSDIVVRINQLLRAKGYTQKDFAQKMEKTPSEISKWLSGDHNLTLRSIAKIAAVLGETIIQVPQREPAIFVLSVLNGTTKSNMAVRGRKSENAPQNLIYTTQLTTEMASSVLVEQYN